MGEASNPTAYEDLSGEEFAQRGNRLFEERVLPHIDDLDIPAQELVSQAERLLPPRTHSVDEATLPKMVLREASEVYERLTREAEQAVEAT